MTELAYPLLVGWGFGWILQRGGLSSYDRIVNVFRFTDLTVLKFLLSALLTGAVGIRTLQTLGLTDDIPVPTTYVAGNFLGGVVFGVGMALSGFCPGTIAAGAGEGRLDYIVPGGLGLYAGAVAYGVAYDAVMPVLTRWGQMGAVTISALLDVEPWLVVALFAELALFVFYFLERGLARSHDRA